MKKLRIGLTTVGLGVSLVGVGGNPALHADTIAGNSLNPAGLDHVRPRDERGLATFKETISRTPTGALYSTPFSLPESRSFGGDWEAFGHLELGALGSFGDKRAAEFIEYSDWDDGLLINSFSLSAHRKDVGGYLDLSGGGIGRSDQYYRIQGGRYGYFKLNGLFSEVPHVYTTGAISFYRGIGTEQLTLPQALVPGGNTTNKIRAALDAARERTLALSRKSGRLGFELTPRSGVKLFASYTREARDGTRPFGGSFAPSFYVGGDQGGLVETTEPIDHTTHTVAAGLHFSSPQYQFNVNYDGSFFRNSKQTLTWENPFGDIPGGGFVAERGRFALSPDNDYHHVQTDFALRLPMRGRFTTTLTWSGMRQNEELLSPTVNSGTTNQGIDLSQWNTTEALTETTADARIDSLLLQAGLTFSPLHALTLRAKVRHYDEDNDTNYTASNALTGDIGYIVEDGAFRGAVFEPGVPSRRWQYRNVPFEQRKTTLSFDGDYRVRRKTVLGLGFQRETIDRRYREREKTEEDRFTLRVSDRSLPWATLRLSAEYADRGGSAYHFNPYEPFYTSSLPGFVPLLPDGSLPHTLADLRKFDLSDRVQAIIDGRVTLLLRDDVDLMVSGKWIDNDYGASFGLRDEETKTVGVEVSYQPFPRLNANGFYRYESRDKRMANINDTGFGTDPDAGGSVFTSEAVWSESENATNHMLGLGVSFGLRRFSLDTSYTLSWSRERIDYQFASQDALSQPPAAPDMTGNSFPDLRFSRHVLQTNLRWEASRNLSLRLYHRYERGRTRDWHFEDLQPLVGRALFLSAVPEDYDAHVVGLFLQYQLR